MRFNSKALLLLLAAMGLSYGYGSGNTIAVTGNVVGGCSTLLPQGAQTLGFGNYDTSSPTDLTTGPLAFSINCTKGDTNFTVSVSGGSNFTHATPSGDRAMTDGHSHYLTYQLYGATGGAQAWAFNTTTGVGTAVNQTAGGLNSATAFSLYGITPHGQTGAAFGNYSDTVVVTVNY